MQAVITPEYSKELLEKTKELRKTNDSLLVEFTKSQVITSELGSKIKIARDLFEKKLLEVGKNKALKKVYDREIDLINEGNELQKKLNKQKKLLQEKMDLFDKSQINIKTKNEQLNTLRKQYDSKSEKSVLERAVIYKDIKKYEGVSKILQGRISKIKEEIKNIEDNLAKINSEILI